MAPAGDVQRDFWLALDLLQSGKDHHEFVLVRDWIQDALASCSEHVEVEVAKSVLKQVSRLAPHVLFEPAAQPASV